MHIVWLYEIFTWSCEISLRIFLSLQHNSTFWSITHSHAKWKYLIFKLSFVISSISSFWIHLNYLQIYSKSRSKCIDSSSSSTLFALLKISFLFCHSMLQKSPWNISKTSQKSLVSLARATMYYLGILDIITTQKVWSSWELLFKMCCFWVVIISISFFIVCLTCHCHVWLRE